VSRKLDYGSLEREYITTEISLRAMAKREGASNSTVSDYARAHGWEEKRKRYTEEVEQRFLSVAAESRARQLSTILDRSVTMLEMIVTRMAIQLAGDEKKGIQPQEVVLKDALDAVRMVQALRGQPGEIREERQVVGHLADPRLLELLGDLARRRLGPDEARIEPVHALPGPVERSA
jgi:hypothetical protein